MNSSNAEPKVWKGQGRFDRNNSTFKHLITIHSKIKNALVEIPGYSKPLLNKEMFDKIVMLEGEIERLVGRGYLFGLTKAINPQTKLPYADKTIKMQFYLCGNYTGEPDELLFTLYPDRYIFEENQDYIQDVRFHTFLKRLYEQAKTGVLITKSLKHKKENGTEKAIFDLTKKRHHDETELYAWCQERVREGHASGLVFQYYGNYADKYFDR